MSNKQIEEMGKILCGMKNGCDGCMWDKIHCNERNYAVEIYNAGYRKQSEGEWIRQDKEKGRVAPEAVCSNCGRDVEYQVIDGKWAFENYCSHCGAKMKGADDEKTMD